MKKFLYFILAVSALVSCQGTLSLDDIESSYCSYDGAKIHYKTYGQGQQSIVFVHGWGCNLDAWKGQLVAFPNSRLVFIDLPGYGKSDKPQVEYTLDFFAKSVRLVLSELNEENVVLVGHSLGTPVCRRVIQNYPDLNYRLCDVDGVYCIYPHDSLQLADYNAQINGFVESFRGDSMVTNVRGFVSSLFISSTPESVKQYADSVMCSTPEFVGYSTMKNLVDTKYWDESPIIVPVLVLCSTNSGIPENYNEVMKELYPNLVYREFANFGHFIMMENPECFNNLLQDFVNGNN